MKVASSRWGTAWRAIERSRGISTRTGMPLYRSQVPAPEELLRQEFDASNGRTCPLIPELGQNSRREAGGGRPGGQAPPVGRRPELDTSVLGLGVEAAVGAEVTLDGGEQVRRRRRVGRFLRLLRLDAGPSQVAIEQAGGDPLAEDRGKRGPPDP